MLQFEFLDLQITPPKDPKPYDGSEDSFQKAIARYLDMRGVLWAHPPNGGSRNEIEAAKLKRMGVKPGLSDILIFEPRGTFSGFALELKAKKNKPTKDQEFWLLELQKRGWATAWTNSMDVALYLIDNYLRLPLVTNENTSLPLPEIKPL